MVDLAELLQFAVAQHRAGNWDEAERAYRQALAQAPRNPSIRRDLAWLLSARDQHQAAVDEMSRAIVEAPGAAPLHADLGTMLRRLGRIDEAMASFRAAIRLDPALWQAQFNLGNAYQQCGQLEPAVECYKQALRYAPDDPEVHQNLGIAQKHLGQLAAARKSFERVMQLKPNHADAWINLGTVCRAEEDLAGAIDCYRRALEIDPRSALAHNNLGLAQLVLNDPAAAIDSFREAVRSEGNYAAAYASLGNAYELQSDAAEARAAFEKAIALGGDEALRIRRALVLPVILESREQIDETRRRLALELDELAARTPHVKNPPHSVGVPAFALAYHGRDERQTQSQIAAIFRSATPSLAFVAPHCRPPAARPAGRLKIGFISAHFHTHTIGKLNAGMIRQWDRQAFEVIVFGFPRAGDEMAARIAASADRWVTLPAGLAEAQSLIADHRLDVLFYTDIGIDPMMYYLAHARLAPVQCVTWGHPLTTGIPTLDYFISSEDLETAGSEAQYTERLVRLPHLANYYDRPEPSTSTKTREEFGFAREDHVYACLQSQFKLHPDDDDVFAAILRRDPRGRLILLESHFASWSEILRKRFGRSIPDVCDRIGFLPKQPPPDFSRLLATVDVLLDPLHFGGGETSYQSFAVGAPIVTLPSGFLRGRITYALYRTMGVDDLIATDADDYVERAVRLANDPARRDAIREKILASNHKIFENPAGVRELEAFLIDAAAEGAAR